jgi:MATE family multidrug resistance protein
MINNPRSIFSVKEIKILLILALPLVITGLIEASVGFTSTLMVANLGHYQLAALGLVSNLFTTLMVVIWGILSATSVLVSQYHGANNQSAVARVFRDSILLSLILSIPAMVLLWIVSPILLLFGQPPAIVTLTTHYLHALAFAMIPDFTGIVMLQFVMGLGHTRVNLLFSLLWVPATILCNYVFIYGKWGIPAFGIAGIGWGTTVSFWITTLILAVYLYLDHNYRPYLDNAATKNERSRLKELFKVGVPLGGMFCIEVSFFMVLALLMGHISLESLAANQITLQFVSQFTVVSFSLAQAITVRMGHTIGAKDIAAAERAGYMGIIIGLVFMCLIAMLYWFFPSLLIAIDIKIHDPANITLVHLAKRFMMLAALFQLFEIVRITTFGALRSLRDTKFTMLISSVMFWGIALPCGYLLAFKIHWQGMGLWSGLVVGAAAGALILFMRFRNRIRVYYA